MRTLTACTLTRATTATAAALLVSGCADRKLPTEAQPAPSTASSATIPFGSPSRIDFLGRQGRSERSIEFSSSRDAKTDLQTLRRDAHTKLTELQARLAAGKADPRFAPVAARMERILAASRPAELRAALEPERSRVTYESSVVRRGATGEHTGSFRLDGRELLRVVTRTPLTASLFEDSGDDPYQFYDRPPEPPPPPPSCIDGTDEYVSQFPAEQVCGYDPSYDPTQAAADAAAMQAQANALQAAAGPQLGDPCYSKWLSYYGSVGGFVVATGKTLFWTWRRNPVRAWRWAQATAASLVAVNVMYAELYGCQNPYSGDRLRV
jgi:hypothetical protein